MKMFQVQYNLKAGHTQEQYNAFYSPSASSYTYVYAVDMKDAIDKVRQNLMDTNRLDYIELIALQEMGAVLE